LRRWLTVEKEGRVLRVIAVVDGRPGHEKQTLGIVEQLRSATFVRLRIVDRSALSFLERCKEWGYLLFPFFVPLEKEFQDADLVIGSGSRTHLYILLLKRKYKLPAFTCMTPAWPLRIFFDCCFVPCHDDVSPAKNIYYTQGAPNLGVDRGSHQKNQGLILLGGIDHSSHFWLSEKIVEQVAMVVRRDRQIHWTISSSPRTPDYTVKAVKELEQTTGNMLFFDFHDTEPGWVEQQYQRCATVWVTSDSISMIYEALSSGCRVNIFPMQWKRHNSKFARNERLLLEGGTVHSYDHWINYGNGKEIQYKLNEARRCARHILRKWWPKNSQ
jgi:mitochondrial fission protein ELM1